MIELDAEQSAAVRSTAPVVVVRAGPGSGKTRVLVARALHLLHQGVPASEIVLMAFTRAAAAEIRERLCAHVQDLPSVTTLHAWAASLVRRHSAPFTVQEQAESDRLVLQVGAELGLPHKTASRLRREDRLLRRYARLMRQSGRMDYADLEPTAQNLLLEGAAVRHRHVLVDEAQDLTRLEVSLITLIMPLSLFVVGDVSQTLFTFRGAEPEWVLGLARGADEHILTRNYRSATNVVAAARRLKLEPRPVPQTSAPGAAPGTAELFREDRLPRALVSLPYRGQAVLAPRWELLEDLAARLREECVPHVVARPARTWSDPRGRRVLQALRLIANPHDRVAGDDLMLREPWKADWRRALAAGMERGASVRDIALELGRNALLVDAWEAWSCDGMMRLVEVLSMHVPGPQRDALDAGLEHAATPAALVTCLLELDHSALPEQGDRVLLTTIHSAKGREWDHVWILGCEDQGLRGSELEVRRKLYVATTRARKSVRWVVRAGDVPSPFVDEMTGGAVWA